MACRTCAPYRCITICNAWVIIGEYHNLGKAYVKKPDAHEIISARAWNVSYTQISNVFDEEIWPAFEILNIRIMVVAFVTYVDLWLVQILLDIEDNHAVKVAAIKANT